VPTILVDWTLKRALGTVVTMQTKFKRKSRDVDRE
jgi:hypothetical protein